MSVAAANSAVMQHHETGVAGIDAVEHADLKRIEPAADAVRCVRSCRWRRLLADCSDNSGDWRASQQRAAALEQIPVALMPSPHRDGVDTRHRPETRTVIALKRRDLDHEICACFTIAAGQRKG